MMKSFMCVLGNISYIAIFNFDSAHNSQNFSYHRKKISISSHDIRNIRRRVQDDKLRPRSRETIRVLINVCAIDNFH